MGLLDSFNMDDPRTMGLLSAAANMLQASGPSLRPVGLGQVLSAGMRGGMESYQGAQDRQQAQAMAAEKLKMLKLQEDRAQAMMRMQQEAFGSFGNGGAPQGGISPSAGQSAPAGVPQQQGGQSAKLDQLRRFAISGVPGAKELFDIYKYENEPQKLEQGSTYVDRRTGSERTMPKLDNGISMNPDGSAGYVPGYAQSVADQAGMTTAAQESAKARYNTTMLPLPGGPRLVSNAQLPDMLGGVQRKGFDPSKLSVETLQYLRKAFPQEFDQGISDFSQRGAAPSGPGIALQSEADREREVGSVRVKNSVDEALAKAHPDVVKNNQTAIAKAGAALGLIDKALKHPGISTATGLQGLIDPRNYIPGTDAKDFQVVMDQIGGQTFLQAFESLKGAGQITEVEGKKATDAIARLNRAQSTEEFTGGLKDLQSVIKSGVDRINSSPAPIDIARGKLGNPVDQQNLAPIQPVATRQKKSALKGQVMDGYRFKGGNPADQNNWEKL